jgi:hypothetical protein
VSWRKKIILFDFDMGAHRGWGIEKLIADGLVEVIRIPMPKPSLMSRSGKLSGYTEAWNEFIRAFNLALDDPEVLTISIDTCTTFWKLIQDAYLQEIQVNSPNRKQLIQIEFGEPNSRMRAVFELAKVAGKDLLMVHHEGDEYAPLLDSNGKPMVDSNNGQQIRLQTGRKIPDGFRNTVGMADWVVRFTPAIDGKSSYTGTVEKSGKDRKWVGIDHPDFDYFNMQVMMANGGAGRGT